MSTENNNQDGASTENEGGEGTESTLSAEEIASLKEQAQKAESLEKEIGSLKRDLKKAQKATEKTPEKTDESNRSSEDIQKLQQKLERQTLRAAGITHADDVELAQKTAEKWGVDIDELMDDPDFQVKLKRQQDDRSNVEATTNVQGDKGKTSNKENPAYWIAKGTPPTQDDVPDRKKRAEIIRAMMSSEKSSKKFYND